MTTTTQNPSSKAPSHFVYSVKQKDGSDKAVWIKVGAAWAHSDGEGLNLILNLLGQDVNLTIRPNKPKTE
ncbi:hypothetical protein CWM47_10155 [Spirosoma pollinicola]|uniref:Uncharacterized protein n=1 Tax=Spirosoma pollinicola TaxID=2057025 RepID=A0A2K8ZBM4_9BACT|nr:hypothetical protein CWM47_10155 [Spirosoma pollinicola]